MCIKFEQNRLMNHQLMASESGGVFLATLYVTYWLFARTLTCAVCKMQVKMEGIPATVIRQSLLQLFTRKFLHFLALEVLLSVNNVDVRILTPRNLFIHMVHTGKVGVPVISLPLPHTWCIDCFAGTLTFAVCTMQIKVVTICVSAMQSTIGLMLARSAKKYSFISCIREKLGFRSRIIVVPHTWCICRSHIVKPVT